MSQLSLVHKSVLTQNPSAPLLFLVHGRAGNVDVMWTFKSYFPKEWNIVSMQAPLPDPVGGFSWWYVHNEKITRESIDQGVQKLDFFIDEFIKANNLTPSVLIAAGFSQGAGCLSSLIQKSPERFKAVALLAGLVIKDQIPNPQLSSTNIRPNIFMAHGNKDDVIPIQKAIEAKEYLESLKFPVQFVTDDVTHKVGTAGMRGLREFLNQYNPVIG
jgi:phospholipase/carboxylesterase